MEMISNIASGTLKPSAAVSGTKEAVTASQSGEEMQDKTRPFKEVRDEYIPEKKQESCGRYWMDRDSKSGTCRVSTDKVDREIEKLKKEQEELKQKINSETDEVKTEELENRLEQVERELEQKDNDAYRRQHAVFS